MVLCIVVHLLYDLHYFRFVSKVMEQWISGKVVIKIVKSNWLLDNLCLVILFLNVCPNQNIKSAMRKLDTVGFLDSKNAFLILIYFPLVEKVVDVLQLLPVWIPIQIDLLIHIHLLQGQIILQVNNIALVEEVVVLIVQAFHNMLLYVSSGVWV